MMRKLLFLLLFIVVVMGILSPKYGFYQHAIADEIAFQAGSLRGENPFTNVAVHVIQAEKCSPFLLPSRVVESDSPEIVRLAKEITKGKRTDIEKSKAIYDWVIRHVTYDDAEYERFKSGKNFSYGTALQTLKTGKGICMEYARLDAALHRAVGIEAKIVYGEEHAWNEIKLAGKWQPQDPTYGSGYLDEETHQFVHDYSEKYFSHSDMKWEGDFEF